MSDTVNPLTDLEETAAAATRGGTSMRDRIRAARARAAKPIRLELPGSGGMLVAEYRSLTEAELKKFGNARTKVGSLLPLVSAACTGVFEREPHQDIDDEDLGRVSAGYDTELAEYLEIEASKDSDVIRGAMLNEDPAIIAHGAELLQRMTNPQAGPEDDDSPGG